MAGSAILNSVMTATGSVEKATIWIRDERELLKKGIKKEGAKGYVSSKGLGMLGAASSLTSYTPLHSGAVQPHKPQTVGPCRR